MKKWIDQTIKNAGWIRVAVSLALLVAYSMWLFREGGEFLTAMSVSNELPETSPGFPVDHTAAIEALRAANVLGGYLKFQLLDVIYAFLNFIAIGSVIALAFNRFGMMASPFRFILVGPVIYFAAEILEDTSIYMLANGNGVAAAVQPFFTITKFASLAPSMVAALLSLIALAVYLIAKLFRKNTA